jgi:hypothetical protein
MTTPYMCCPECGQVVDYACGCPNGNPTWPLS